MQLSFLPGPHTTLDKSVPGCDTQITFQPGVGLPVRYSEIAQKREKHTHTLIPLRLPPQRLGGYLAAGQYLAAVTGDD